MSTRIPHLPDELHLFIGQYVHRDDLANYRLASKLFLSIGTAELFGTLTFHYSTASLARLASISNCEHLRKHVKTIFWDVNLWSIPDVRKIHEWQTYFYNKAVFLRTCNHEEQAGRLDRLALNRKEWVSYLDKVDDEKVAKRDPSRLDALKRFYDLHKIHVVHGELVPAHRGLRKVGDQVNSASTEPVVLCRGEGMNDLLSRTGSEAFQCILKIPNPRLMKLKLDRIYHKAFASTPVSYLTNLRSIDIKITARADSWDGIDSGWHIDWYGASISFEHLKLRLFLQQLRHLECLKIDLDCGHEKSEPLERRPFAVIQEVFNVHLAWPRLRKLALCNFYATPESLLSLLTSHRETLKDLRLRNLVLEERTEEEWLSSESGNSGDDPASLVGVEEYGWPEILQHMAGCLDLQRATLSGRFATEVRNQGSWDLDTNHEFAAAISDYLVRGGRCPW